MPTNQSINHIIDSASKETDYMGLTLCRTTRMYTDLDYANHSWFQNSQYHPPSVFNSHLRISSLDKHYFTLT